MGPDSANGAEIFDCIQCGKCCKGFGGTYVKEGDIIRIAAYINCPSEDFVKNYCEKSGSKLVLACDTDGCCVFFDSQRQCTIHPVKPYMCKAWPFIRPVLRHPENWNMMAGSCPGMKKDIPETLLLKIVKAEIEKMDEIWEEQKSLLV